MIVNDSAECSLCALGPPPDMILRLPPPPMPGFLMRASGPELDGPEPEGPGSAGGPCRHTCEWRGEGVQYVEVPQQGTLFDDTWFIVLISACVGIVFVGIVLATFMYKCKLEPDVAHPNDDASQCSNRSNKNSTLSTSTASSGMQTTTTSGGPCSKLGLPRLMQSTEAVLYPCNQQQQQQQQQDALADSRVMWATLTPRGTTRHYVEEHTYETIGASGPAADPADPGDPAVYGEQRPPDPPPPLPPLLVTPAMMGSRHGTARRHHQHHHHLHHHHHHHQQYGVEPGPNEHTYSEPPPPPPPVPSPPVPARPKNEKAFDNTAFVDYEDPHQMKNEYYQLEDVLEPCDPIFSVQGLYSMQPRMSSCSVSGCNNSIAAAAAAAAAGTLRPRVSSPTRIEHPNLPPLNLQPSLPRNKSHHHQHHQHRKNSFHTLGGQHQRHNHHHHHQQQQQQQQQQNHSQQGQQQQTPGDCTILRSGMTSGSTTYIPTI